MNLNNWQPANNATPIIHAFTSQREILVDTNVFISLDLYKLLVSDAVVDHIVTQTNKYVEDYIFNPPTPLKQYSCVYK